MDHVLTVLSEHNFGGSLIVFVIMCIFSVLGYFLLRESDAVDEEREESLERDYEMLHDLDKLTANK